MRNSATGSQTSASSPAADDGSADGRPLLAALSTTMADAAEAALWTQWAALGASAAAERSARALIDPEALVLASLTLGGREPRLIALTHDWVALNADLLSVQRVRNLAPAFPDITAPLCALAHTASTRAKDARWRAIARDAASSDPASTPSAGVARVPRGTKVRAVRAPVNVPPALMLRLRLMLSVGIKADILAFALGAGHLEITVRTMAAATGYSDAAVRRAADDLAAAKVVDTLRVDGVTLYLPATRPWAALLGMRRPFPPWRAWQARYACAAAVIAWGDVVRTAERPLSTYAFEVKARELAVTHFSALQAIVEPTRGSLPSVQAVSTASVVSRFERFAATFERDV